MVGAVDQGGAYRRGGQHTGRPEATETAAEDQYMGFARIRHQRIMDWKTHTVCLTDMRLP